MEITIAAPSQEFFEALCHALGLDGYLSCLRKGSNKNAFEEGSSAIIARISAETKNIHGLSLNPSSVERFHLVR